MTKLTAPHLLAPDTVLPWLTTIWSRLQASRTAGRLAHGWLISGSRGVGKRHLAEQLARSLLCPERDENGMACGHCTDCHLLNAGSHPDLIRVGSDPEAKSDEITIGSIRAFAERESLTPSRADWKVALIDPADRLNPAAANALLKTLEEPAGQTILCLIGERIGQLPTTIRSRCQQIKIPTPTESEALAWLVQQSRRDDLALRLRLAHGAPLRALAESDESLLEQRQQRLAGLFAVAAGKRDPVSEAVLWDELGARQMLDWLAGWLCDLLRLIVAQEPARLDNPDRQADFAMLARRLNPTAAHRLLQQVLLGYAHVENNVNQRLLLEDLAIEWFRLNQGLHERS